MKLWTWGVVPEFVMPLFIVILKIGAYGIKIQIQNETANMGRMDKERDPLGIEYFDDVPLSTLWPVVTSPSEQHVCITSSIKVTRSVVEEMSALCSCLR